MFPRVDFHKFKEQNFSKEVAKLSRIKGITEPGTAKPIFLIVKTSTDSPHLLIYFPFN